jgi:branched-chain amino acid transport system substrate-binding protein
MNTKSIIGSIVVIIILLAVVLGGKKSGVENPVDDGVITVGAILPLSGPTAQFGEIFKSAMETRLNGNQNIKIIYEDSKNDPAAAISAFQKLNNQGVDVVISNLTKPSVPLAPVALQSKLPLIVSLVAGKSIMKDSANDYVFRLFWTTDDYADAFLSRIENSGYKKIALLQGKNEASQETANRVVSVLRERGIEIVWETFQDTDTDFRTQLQKIKSEDVDAIGLVVIPAGQWKAILSQANDIGISSNIAKIYDVIGTMQNPGTPEAVGELSNNVHTYNTPFGFGEYKPEALAEIQQKTGRDYVGSYDGFGYDTGSLLIRLLESKNTSREAIHIYLNEMKSFDGVTGVYSTDGKRTFKPQIMTGKMENGIIVKSVE